MEDMDMEVADAVGAARLVVVIRVFRRARQQLGGPVEAGSNRVLCTNRRKTARMRVRVQMVETW